MGRRSRSKSPFGTRRRDREKDTEWDRDQDRERVRGKERHRSRRSRDRSRDRERSRNRSRDRKISRDRSRNRSQDRKRGRHFLERDDRRRYSRSRSRSPERNRKNLLPDRPAVTAADLEGKSVDEQEMMKLMGFSNFDTTKGKKVEGNNAGGVHVIVKRKYRQYMNRKGGFNRPLDHVD